MFDTHYELYLQMYRDWSTQKINPTTLSSVDLSSIDFETVGDVEEQKQAGTLNLTKQKSVPNQTK